MYSLNSNEKEYDIEELKKNWFFKLIVKFLKQQNLYYRVLSIPIYGANGKNKIISTMHSNNYCISKLFFWTISCSIPREYMEGMEGRKYDKLWCDYIKEHLNMVPEDIREIISRSNSTSLEEWFDTEYHKTYYNIAIKS